MLAGLISPIRNRSRQALKGVKCSVVPYTQPPNNLMNVIHSWTLPETVNWQALVADLKQYACIDTVPHFEDTEPNVRLVLWADSELRPITSSYRDGAPWYRRWLTQSHLVPDHIKGYLSTVSEYDPGGGFIYRGEGEAYSGPIRSRLARQWELDEPGLVDLQRTLLREARQYVDYDNRQRLLAECQHIGIPMNVIDFTDDPAVALWFASSGSIESDGQLRVLEESHMSGRAIRLAEPPQRMIDQMGLLVYVENGEIRENEVSRTMQIDRRDKPEIVQVLNESLGITRNRLFRDLDGFRHEIETGRIRFVRAELLAGALAIKRGDYGRAVEFLERCVASHRNQRPGEDGGFPNIVPLHNLAIAYVCVGEEGRAERTAARALKIAERTYQGRNDSDGKHNLMRTRDLYRKIKRARRFKWLFGRRGLATSD